MEPEGSAARANARIFLLGSIRRALEDGLSADEWVELMQVRVPEAIEEAGDRDFGAIVQFALGEHWKRRRRR